MLATRCKPRWPGSPRIFSPARPMIRTRARCLATEASPDGEGGRDGDETGGDGSSHSLSPRKQRRSAYVPRAYEPEPMSYVDILYRATVGPMLQARQISRQLKRALQPGGRPPADETPGQPAEPSHVLDRSLVYVASVSERLEPIVSAVSEDLSHDLVPKAYTHRPDAIHTHHLGRWYARWMRLEFERRAIERHLGSVAANTVRARSFITSMRIRRVEQALRVQKDAKRSSLAQHRGELEAVAYALACELRLARLAEQWHRVWALERRLASTVSLFLPSRPLASAFRNLRDRDDGGITEISMSRMAEWDDSYKSLYEEDVHMRKGVNLVERYRAIFNSAVHEKPWKGGAVRFAFESPFTGDKEFVVLRLDQSSTPSLLWPRDWRPVERTGDPAGSDPAEMPQNVKRRTTWTPAGTKRKWIRKGETGKGPKSERQEQPSPDTHAKPEVSEARNGA